MVLASSLLIAAIGACKAEKKAEPEAVQIRTVAAPVKNLVGVLASAPDLATLSHLVSGAGLQQVLGGRASYTIFAPTDAAFASLPGEQRNQLESADGRPQLIALLRQHIAPGYITPVDIERGLARTGAGNQLATVGAAPISLRKQGASLLIGNSDYAPRVVGAPLTATNGMIYRIDRVLPPLTGRR
jgi:uncharacterized surface protein with fasciclin (FAS1) repeats